MNRKIQWVKKRDQQKKRGSERKMQRGLKIRRPKKGKGERERER